jgi:acetyl-CoA carboxylase carboxyltransferase component
LLSTPRRNYSNNCGNGVPKTRAKLIEEYNDKFANPYVAAERGYLDDVIEPQETRPRLIRALRMLAHKRQSLPPKKHGNLPL